jgi:hypothetical protein
VVEVPGQPADAAVPAPEVPAAPPDAPAPTAAPQPVAAREDEGPLLLSPEEGSRPGGPMHARIVREQQQSEVLERAQRWEEMRRRERQAAFPTAQERVAEAKGSGDRPPIVRYVLAAAVLLALLGGGAYYLFAMPHEARLTAADAWEEFSKDTPAAQKKYKGQFVQIRGKLQVVTSGKTTRLYFERPATAKWGITFVLPVEQAKKVQSGQEITVRCRFGTRKEPDGDLLLSNCNLVSAS